MKRMNRGSSSTGLGAAETTGRRSGVDINFLLISVRGTKNGFNQ